jgi:Ni/Fe-hydrogenase subunit HybB-like protein
MNAHAEVVPGPLWTRGMKTLAAVAGLGIVLLAWRFAAGLGAVTGLSDGYPWGLWIAFDVVTGTALGCGGYAIAILVYVLNRGQYHPLVRPAVLTSALGYSLAAIAIVVDVGRPWFIYRIPLHFWQWNLDSALLEVALCVMAYVVVLWVEMTPAVLERWRDSQVPMLRRVAETVGPVLDRALVFVLALGVLLPTMHQSSLGTVMLLAGDKLHPLWRTPLLPLLFLVSCIAMGYAVVVFEGALAAAAFRRRPETPMLASLSRAMVVVVALYLALRFLDLGVRGQLGRVLTFDRVGLLFLLETALFVVPGAMLLDRRRGQHLGHLFRAATLLLLGGALYRFDSYLLAFNPGPGWSYFPAVPELLITLGLVAGEVMVYVALVKSFPILGGQPAPAHA